MQPSCYGFYENDHDYAIIDITVELMNRGFTCYLEHIILLGGGKRLGYRVVVDIYAKRNEEEILIEVGSLSGDNRLMRLKALKPTAQIIHVTQWKNFIPSYDWVDAKVEWLRKCLESRYLDKTEEADIIWR